MKSILRQLSKYQDQAEQLIINLPAQMTGSDENGTCFRDKLRLMFLNVCDLSSGIDKQHYMFMMQSVPETKWYNILYPLEMLISYHIFYKFKRIPASEARIDSLLLMFMSKVDPIEFQNRLKEAIDTNILNITMARVLLATFCDTAKDNLPDQFRQPAATHLGVNATARCASDKLEELVNKSSVEQIIVGRMCFLAIWHAWKKNETTIDQPILSLANSGAITIR